MSNFHKELVNMQQDIFRITIFISAHKDKLVKLNANLEKYLDKIKEKDNQANQVTNEFYWNREAKNWKQWERSIEFSSSWI